MNQPGSKAAADAATAQSAADRLAKIRPSESYADSVYDAYGSLPKGQLWRDLDTLITAARALWSQSVAAPSASTTDDSRAPGMNQ
jgi:hypothetical protein